jgi:hypothetical protein
VDVSLVTYLAGSAKLDPLVGKSVTSYEPK